MKKIIYLCFFVSLIFTPVFVLAWNYVDFDESTENKDISDTRAELEELRVDQKRKEAEAAGKKGLSDVQEMEEIQRAESTYDD